MTDIPDLIEIAEPPKVFIPLTDEFHTVNHLIPNDQELSRVPPEMLVVDALEIMREKHYSQLPVLAGNRVLGVFSYRSFAENFIKVSTGEDRPDLSKLRVIEFIEKAQYVQVLEDIELILAPLNEKDYLLVGEVDRLFGVVTASDLARFYYLYASILMLFREIELTVRKIFQACIDDRQLQDCIRITLSRIYTAENLPRTVDDMTMNDYAQLIGDGRCYPHFEKVFGSGDWMRKRTRTKLEEIRDLRNDAFHFKREMTTHDIDSLFEYRDWLKKMTMAYEVQNKGD